MSFPIWLKLMLFSDLRGRCSVRACGTRGGSSNHAYCKDLTGYNVDPARIYTESDKHIQLKVPRHIGSG